MNDLQKKAVADILERLWGCNFQTGRNGDALTLWAKLGPAYPAVEYRISIGGHITSDDVDWDGHAFATT